MSPSAKSPGLHRIHPVGTNFLKSFCLASLVTKQLERRHVARSRAGRNPCSSEYAPGRQLGIRGNPTAESTWLLLNALPDAYDLSPAVLGQIQIQRTFVINMHQAHDRKEALLRHLARWDAPTVEIFPATNLTHIANASYQDLLARGAWHSRA